MRLSQMLLQFVKLTFFMEFGALALACTLGKFLKIYVYLFIGCILGHVQVKVRALTLYQLITHQCIMVSP